jgi:hypothetical protein
MIENEMIRAMIEEQIISGKRVSLDSLTPYKNGHAVVNGWHVRVEEDVEWDYACYSKSWNSKYGGRKVVTGRNVQIRRVTADGGLESRDQAVGSFRGNYILDAIVQAGILPDRSGPMSVRLHAAYDARIVRAGRSVKIYVRTLANEVVDFCAVVRGTTFHAPTIKEAIAGLRTKLSHVVMRKNASLVDWKLCKSLGFCDTGISQFAQEFDFDIHASYTPNEIATRVKSNLSAAAPYISELNTLAKAVNYEITSK